MMHLPLVCLCGLFLVPGLRGGEKVMELRVHWLDLRHLYHIAVVFFVWSSLYALCVFQFLHSLRHRKGYFVGE